MIENKKNLIIFGLGVMFVSLAMYVLYFSIYSAELMVWTAPRKVSVFVDGKKIEQNKYVRVKPGKKKIKVERDGFETREMELELQSEKKEIKVGLLAKEGNDYYNKEENREDAERLTMILEQNYEAEQDDMVEKIKKEYPVVKYMPFELGLSKRVVSYFYDSDEKKVIFTITNCVKNRDNVLEAKNEIKEFGFDGDGYEYRCVNWK